VNFTCHQVANLQGSYDHPVLALNHVGSFNSVCTLNRTLNCASTVDCAVPQGHQCLQSYFSPLQGDKTVSFKTYSGTSVGL